MTRKSILSFFTAVIMAVLCIFSPLCNVNAKAATKFVLLSSYSETVAVKDEFYLVAVTSTGKQATFKSSDSKIASVNTYGLVTAKKAGSCKITAKISGAEASCWVKVVKTTLSLSKTSLSLENGKSCKLTATCSTGHSITWKSAKSSVASVSEKGLVTANKVGSTTITASVDGVSKTCKVTVKSPTIKLSDTSKTLHRTESFKLTAKVSSGKTPTWKSNKTSVATVDSNGTVTAVKHGAATISCTVDGVTATCTIYVQQPVITLSASTLSLKVGDTYALTADVSTGVYPEWSSSNINVVEVDANGNLVARSKGKAYIYAKEDGVKTSCIVTVTE